MINYPLISRLLLLLLLLLLDCTIIPLLLLLLLLECTIIPSFTITVVNFYFSTFTSASIRMYNYPLISRLLPRGAPSNSAELSELASGSKLPIDLIRAGLVY